MTCFEVARAAFLDELEKIAWARKFHIPKERTGRRSMSVATLLKRDNAGTLLKHSSSLGSSVPFSLAPNDPNEARIPKRLGDLPSKEDPAVLNRMDGRGEAATVHGPGTVLSNIMATNTGNYT